MSSLFAAGVAAQERDATKAVPMSRVEVLGERVADEGYRVDAVNAPGPLGNLKLLDTPYTIGILPRELIENSQARNFKEASKYLPLVSYQEQQGPQILRPQTRGLQGGNFQNSRADGMTMYVTVANAMEQFEQIEVVNGVSAALYGPANPSGMFNFVSKRPALRPFARVNLGYDSDAIATAHLDAGGPVDRNGVVSYRLNALRANGEGYVRGSSLDRQLGAIAVDVRPVRDLVLELTLSDYRLTQKGYPAWFTYGQAVVLPDAPDPSRGYGQTYSGVTMQTRMGIARVRYDLGADWHFVAGFLNQDASRDINTAVDNLRDNLGNYTSSLANGFAPRFVIDSDTAYLNGTLRTGAIAHDLVVGTAGYRSRAFAVTNAASAASVLLGNASLDDPRTFAAPAVFPNTRDNFLSSTIYQQGVSVGDTVRFSDAWSTRLAVSQDWFRVANYNVRRELQPGYRDSGASPTASLMFKPRADMTFYATWASSLQAGDLAPGTAANAGVGLAPYRSKQAEAGWKASLGRVDFGVTLFQIERPFANIDPVDKVFRISGIQRNRGIEATAVGKPTDRLAVYAGFTILDARLRDTNNAATEGKTFVGQPRFKSNVLLEYRLPWLQGLFATLDWQGASTRQGNDTNTFKVDGYNVFDVGARYRTTLFEHATVWRLAVVNVTDVHYWSTVAPSNLTGANTGNMVAHLGTPRTVAATVSIDF